MRNVASKWSGWLALATLLGASAYLIAFLARGAQQSGVRAFDIYSYSYPVMVYAADAVRHGGQGLYWNSWQDCGQPFLGSGTTGVLYPPFLFSLALDGDHALYALLFFNVAVGAIGTYLLCRELGVVTAAALCGGLAFGFSNAAVDLITFTPILSGPYAWMPAGMLCCERILRVPTLRAGVALGVVLTLAMLPGHPQLLLFIYQLLALRVLFEMASRRTWLGPRTLGLVLLGFVLPPLLGAVHLVPALEVMRNSVRSSSLSAAEMQVELLTWAGVRKQFAFRGELFNPFVIVPVMLASVAVCTTRLRRQALFYGVLVLVIFDLAMGSNGYLFQLYARLPLVRLFRGPDRYLYALAFCVAVLVAIGVDAVLSRETRSGQWLRRLGGAVLPAAAVGVLHWWTPNVGTVLGESLIIPAVLAGCMLAAFVPRLRGVAAVVLVAAMFLNVLVFRQVPFRHLYPSGDVLYANAPVFHLLHERMTPQERIHVVGKHADAALQQKTGSLFGIPALNDYDSLPTYRFANYFTMFRTGAEMADLNSFYFPFTGMLPQGLRRRLIDLAAVRYLVVDSSEDKTAAVLRDPPLKLLFRVHPGPRPAPTAATAPEPPPGPVTAAGDVRVYENTTALPRARWVPRVDVVPDPSALLQRLSAGTDDLTNTALLEAPPPSGFRGEGEDTAPGTVTFVRNDPEDLILQVEAPRRGFVLLADQWFAGWRATVDGAPTTILRANYLFRLVEVPAGRSTLEFRYVPDALRAGVMLSVATACVLGLALFRTRRRAGIVDVQEYS
jgi:hypothetical protein